MTEHTERLHLAVSGASHRERGVRRGTLLAATLPAAYTRYAELFRLLGVDEAAERDGVARVAETLGSWRPRVLEELEGVAEGAGIEAEQVIALNARTEIIALGARGSHECSTVTAWLGGRPLGVQTWDWHIELDEFWHTHEVAGPGYRHAGLTEQGILSKIGVNERGLALHFNILGHRDDAPSGVPMHLLSSVVLSECASVSEAIDVIASAPISSSSAFTMLDTSRTVSVEMSPAGFAVIDELDGSVQRTNHFQAAELLAGQKNESYEPDSSERLALVRSRLAGGSPASGEELVRLLVSGEGEAPLSCRADMSKGYGERWATLATVVSDPAARSIRILDGMPTDAETGSWRELTV
ncbi:C45 family autoproteolytic acyltransferase/hydolase [Leucobacter massiliensis]|uniref:Peptidase C45 hydrolase domain-containing protein n=1 Tax=Leucobacter massiliensis TaxID=1686285 RepID=A0A2S9QNY4_9MICO|nr:C45 family peptidase [Leucobacter massiliensis]PRI11296.1 hypothetical protein B4915_10675 [Leucobacter massiliensis]